MKKSILHKILKYFGDLWCDFTENQRFSGKWLISDNFILVACARAHTFLRQYLSDRSEIFGDGLLYKNKGLDQGNKSFNYFFLEKRSRALVQRMIKMMPKYEKCQKSS